MVNSRLSMECKKTPILIFLFVKRHLLLYTIIATRSKLNPPPLFLTNIKLNQKNVKFNNFFKVNTALNIDFITNIVSIFLLISQKTCLGTCGVS